jgi:hypothetical protein
MSIPSASVQLWAGLLTINGARRGDASAVDIYKP